MNNSPDDLTLLIGQIAAVRNSLAEQDPDEWPVTYGGIAASQADIDATEERLGYPLDAQFKNFLRHINGWPNFFSDISILSHDQVGNGSAWARAGQILSAYYDYETPPDFPLIGELFPIGVSAFQNDVLSIVRTGRPTDDGLPVIWLANDEVERFANLGEMLSFFLGQMRKALANA